jgi:hypothetical protein
MTRPVKGDAAEIAAEVGELWQKQFLAAEGAMREEQEGPLAGYESCVANSSYAQLRAADLSAVPWRHR